MALIVTCPNCGPRSYSEFWFGGELPDTHNAPPPIAGRDDARLEADYARVWLHANVAGPQRERWFHHAGCRRWLTADRNTLTNEMHGVG